MLLLLLAIGPFRSPILCLHKGADSWLLMVHPAVGTLLFSSLLHTILIWLLLLWLLLQPPLLWLLLLLKLPVPLMLMLSLMGVRDVGM